MRTTIATFAALAVVGGFLACGDSGETTAGSNSNSSSNGGAAAGGDGSGDGGTLSLGGNMNAGGGQQGCNEQTFTLQQAPAAQVYLVIDRSGSMNDDGATMGVSKWDDLKGAVDVALTGYENTVEFGVLMYPSGDECSTQGPQVKFGINNKTPINNALLATVPAGGTPTAAALNNAAASLVDLGSTDAQKFIILATDGGPNCNYFIDASQGCSCTQASMPQYCCTQYPGTCYFGHTCLDDQGTLDTIANLQSSYGIDTFVIGLPGTAEYEPLLNAMAVAGGKPQVGALTDYYAVTDQTSLSTALQTIAVSVISCQIVLQMPPQVPGGVKVFLDDGQVPHDESKTNGWDYTDDTNTTIELYGAACDTLQDGQEHTLTATFECTID
jgi:hypothetical protein